MATTERPHYTLDERFPRRHYLLTTGEVAERLKVSAATVRELLDSGELPSVQERATGPHERKPWRWVWLVDVERYEARRRSREAAERHRGGDSGTPQRMGVGVGASLPLGIPATRR